MENHLLGSIVHSGEMPIITAWDFYYDKHLAEVKDLIHVKKFLVDSHSRMMLGFFISINPGSLKDICY